MHQENSNSKKIGKSSLIENMNKKKRKNRRGKKRNLPNSDELNLTSTSNWSLEEIPSLETSKEDKSAPDLTLSSKVNGGDSEIFSKTKKKGGKRKKNKMQDECINADNPKESSIIKNNKRKKSPTLLQVKKRKSNHDTLEIETITNGDSLCTENQENDLENESDYPYKQTNSNGTSNHWNLLEHFNTSYSEEENSYGDISDLFNDNEHIILSENDDVKEDAGIYDEIENTENKFNDHGLVYKMFEIENKYCVVLNYAKTISLFGFCNLKLLHGKINIFGYNLTANSPKCSIYSPKGSALLTLTNTSELNKRMVPLKDLMPHLNEELKLLKVRMDCAIIICSKRQNSKLNFIETHISQVILPKDTTGPRLLIEPNGPWNKISIPEKWNDIASKVQKSTKMFICGGKGVGKSTFLRYTVNSLLEKYTEIVVVDLDPGQSEFTVPGCISIVTVIKPLLGVNYTHLQETDRSILCDINVAQDPHKYIKCIAELLSSIELKQKDCPILINFMGFATDMAFYLLSSAVALLQPNEIVYIRSSNKKRNFKINLRKDALRNSSKLFTPKSKIDADFDIIEAPSMTDESMAWKLEPRQVREMCILAYFGMLMKEGINSLQNCEVPSYVFDYKAISITNRDNIEVHVDAINASIIALCSLKNDEFGIYQCFGWGIVRAVDPVGHIAIVITPLKSDVLSKVTHFVAGCLALPPSICMNNENALGKIPYVVEGKLIDFAQMSKRTQIPCRKSRK